MSIEFKNICKRSISCDSESLYFVILFFLLVFIFFLNCALDGSIASPLHLARELESPRSAPQDWVLQTQIPMKYRALFSWIVRGTWLSLLPNSGANGFYATYLFWSFVFFYAAVIALYYWLRMLEFDKLLSFLGCILFLGSPPVTLAYVWPVHTREDPLAYLLVILGIIAVSRSEVTMLVIISMLGGLTRETTLIVPFVYLFYTRESFHKKFLVFLLSVSSVIGIRVLLGYQPYNPLHGGIYNFGHLPETIIFLFLTYGVLWMPSLATMYNKWKKRASFSYSWRVLVSSAPACLGLILGTNLIFARVREIRISFLMFPWIIPMCLCWLRANSSRFKPLFSKRYYWLCTVFVFVFLYFVFISLLELTNFGVHLGAVSSRLWRITGYVHLFLTLVIVLPILLKDRLLHLNSIDYE